MIGFKSMITFLHLNNVGDTNPRLQAPTIYVNYHQTSNIIRTLVANKMVDHSDVVGASPVGSAPTTSSFST